MHPLPLDKIKEISVPVPGTLNETQRILKEALTRLGPNGENWHQGGYHNEQRTAFCAVGSLNMVEYNRIHVGDWSPALGALHEAARSILQRGADGAGMLNDEAKSFSEVRAMFEKAIALAANLEGAA